MPSPDRPAHHAELEPTAAEPPVCTLNPGGTSVVVVHELAVAQSPPGPVGTTALMTLRSPASGVLTVTEYFTVAVAPIASGPDQVRFGRPYAVSPVVAWASPL